MSEIKIVRGTDHIEIHIPISNQILELANYLNRDDLTPRKYYKAFREMERLIEIENNINIPRHDSWTTAECDDTIYIIFDRTNDPIPPCKLRTGHIYFNTEMEGAEGADNCGVCNGAKCNDCHEVWRAKDGLLHNWPPTFEEIHK